MASAAGIPRNRGVCDKFRDLRSRFEQNLLTDDDYKEVARVYNNIDAEAVMGKTGIERFLNPFEREIVTNILGVDQVRGRRHVKFDLPQADQNGHDILVPPANDQDVHTLKRRRGNAQSAAQLNAHEEQEEINGDSDVTWSSDSNLSMTDPRQSASLVGRFIAELANQNVILHTQLENQHDDAGDQVERMGELLESAKLEIASLKEKLAASEERLKETECKFADVETKLRTFRSLFANV